MRSTAQVPPRVVYLHGFNSSPASQKARLFLDFCRQRGIDAVAPALHFDPAIAIGQAEAALLAGVRPALLVGSSLGGYYATWLAERHDLRAALINPAVAPHATLGRQFLGPHTNLYTGERYDFTEAQVGTLAKLQVTALSKPSNFLLLLQTGDEVLDYRLAVDYYRGATQIVMEGGNHAFAGFADVLPDLLAFAGLQSHTAKQNPRQEQA
jgi:uncharacterized protein